MQARTIPEGPEPERVINGLTARLASSAHTLTVFDATGPKEYPYRSLHARVAASAERIRALVDGTERIGIVADNTIEFVVVDLACIAAGVCTVCIDHQAGLSDDAAAYFDAMSVRTVIAHRTASASQRAARSLRIVRYDDIVDAAATDNPNVVPAAPKPHPWADQDILTIKQTSGSTGIPKAIAATVVSIDDTLSLVQALFRHGADDRVLVFLPLYLVQQRYWLYSSIYFGFDAILTSAKYAFGVLSVARPTVVMGVPKFYDLLRERILLKARLGAPAAPPSDADGPSDEAVKAAATAVLGPSVRYLWTGSAPCSQVALAFFWQVGVPLLEGYGTNETDIISKNSLSDYKVGSVGKVLPNRRVLLGDAGQISVWKKYPVTTRYELGEDGSGGFAEDVFVTGDLGYIDEQGYLFIRGRVGDAFVLESGISIHPREIELKLEKSDLIDFAVVYGHNRPYLVAIIDPTNRAVERAAIEDVVFALSSDAGSAKRVGKVILTKEPFTEANECLSPQMKIVRRRILQRYSEEIESCYTA